MEGQSFVQKGAVLVERRATRDGGTRYRLWTVTAARTLLSGDIKATLLRGDASAKATATATFIKGAHVDWRPLTISTDDLAAHFADETGGDRS